VPLAVTSDVHANQFLPRSTVAEVQKLILEDLLDARSLLPDNTMNTRASKYAAAALLARVYLYGRDWQQAENYSSEVMDANKFSLVPSLKDVFSATSNETIFQVQPVQTYSTSEGINFIPAAGTTPTYILTDLLKAAFEPGDLRKIAWVDSINIGLQTFHYPYKYKIKNGNPAATENKVLLRLGEIILIRAEARAHLGKNMAAVEDINRIRSRAGLSMVALNSPTAECLETIFREWRVELMFEDSNYWLLLKRTNRSGEVLSPLNLTNWQPTDTLYPIPSSEIQKDPNLGQNVGY